MNHGSSFAYIKQSCRCDECRAWNTSYRAAQRRKGYRGRHPRAAERVVENRRVCLICGTALNVHPIKACWREVR